MSEYEKQYRSFLKGTFLIKGWDKRKTEILDFLPPNLSGGVDEFLTILGDKIGREWAKDKKARKIDSELLIKWGKTIRKAKDQGPETLLSVLKEIDTRVDEILS
jgi:hypothetical protein